MKAEHVLIGLWAVGACGGAVLLLSALVCGIRALIRSIGRHGLKLIALLTLVGLLSSCRPGSTPDTVEVTTTTYVTGSMK